MAKKNANGSVLILLGYFILFRALIVSAVEFVSEEPVFKDCRDRERCPMKPIGRFEKRLSEVDLLSEDHPIWRLSPALRIPILLKMKAFLVEYNQRSEKERKK